MPDAWHLNRKPEGMDRRPCPKVGNAAEMKAHGPHVWRIMHSDSETTTEWWCNGLPVHPNTMIGGNQGG